MICLDTMVVLWGIQSFASETQEPMIRRTKAFLNNLSEEGEIIMIPTPVVSESFIGLTPEEVDAFRSVMEKRFYIPSFDMAAAVLAAKLESDLAAVQEIRSTGATRKIVRADAQIVAIAKVAGANKIISHDPHIMRLARGVIDVENVPESLEQTDLFSDDQ